MDTSTPGRRTRIQPSSLPGGAPSTVYLRSVPVCATLPSQTLVYILSGDKKGDTYEFVLNVIKHYFDQHCPVDTGTCELYPISSLFPKSTDKMDHITNYTSHH